MFGESSHVINVRFERKFILLDMINDDEVI